MQDPLIAEENVCDQQFIIHASSDSGQRDSDNGAVDSGKANILLLLDKQNQNGGCPSRFNKKNRKQLEEGFLQGLSDERKSGGDGESRFLLKNSLTNFRENGSKKKTSKKELNNSKKANNDTKSYLKEIQKSDKYETNETNCKAEEDYLKSTSKKSKKLNQMYKESKDDSQEKYFNSQIPLKKSTPSLVENLLEKAHRGKQGLGYIPKNAFQRKRPSTEFSNSNILTFSNLEHPFTRANYFEKRRIDDAVHFPSNSNNNLRRPFEGSLGQAAVMGKRESMHTLEGIHFCEAHEYKEIEFICSMPGCLKEMCSLCILDHTEHIGKVKHIHSHIREQYEEVRLMDLKKIKTDINSAEENHSRKLDLIYEEIKDILHKKINGLKDNLVHSNNQVRKALEHMEQFKEKFSMLDQNPRFIEMTSFFPKKCTNLVKSCISFPSVNSQYGINVEAQILKQKLNETLRDNISMTSSTTNFNSVDADVPKFLHWFEWGERNLHLYDIVNNRSQSIKLINNIKIPNFSRSIVIPEGKIFLLGGEDPEGQPKKEIYQFDLANLDSEHILEPKALMPHQKYDFTLCYLDGFIYVICGKDTSSEAVNICER